MFLFEFQANIYSRYKANTPGEIDTNKLQTETNINMSKSLFTPRATAKKDLT